MPEQDEPEPQKRGNGLSRRDFIGLVGMAVGGVHLAGCGGGHASVSGSGLAALGKAPLPNAWGFNTLLDTTRAVALGDIMEFTPAIMLNDNGQIVFYAITASGFGLFEADTTTKNARRAVTAVRSIAKIGDTLPDGKTLGRFGGMDLNNQGSVAMVVQPPVFTADGTETLTQEAEGVYISRNGGAVQPVLTAGDPVPNKNASFGGVFGDLDISDGDNILVTGYYGDEDAHENKEGLFYLPAGANPHLEISTGDPVPGSNQMISSLGLLDAGMKGTDYAFMAASNNTETEVNNPVRSAVSRDDVASRRGSLILTRRMGDPPGRAAVLHASSKIRTTRFADTSGGEIHLAPRQGKIADTVSAYVEHRTDTNMSLRINGVTVISTGQKTPTGAAIVSFGAPTVGTNSVYYTAITDTGIEIIATNGSVHKTVIARGAVVDGKTVNSLAMGFHPDQVNASGTIVVYAEMTDKSVVYLEGVPM